MNTFREIKGFVASYWQRHSSSLTLVGTVFFIVLFIAIVLSRAWVCDDSYITFRVVENFHSGYGLRWNVVERVQVYTHPLWMLMMTVFYTFTHEVYLTSISLSIFLSLGAVFLLISREKQNLGLWIGLLLLSLSSVFTDYSTSGLENALSHFLLASFLYWYFKESNERDKRRLIWLSVIAGLACLNRLDQILIYLPPLIYLIIDSKKRWSSAVIVASGLIPLLFWLGFSTIYYGYPLPNTFYAKVGDWLPPDVLMWQGWQYCLHTLKNDPITGLTIISGLVLAGTNYKAGRIPLALGVLAYIFYVIWIGGDFMEGRFFTSLFMLSVFQLVHYDLQNIRIKCLSWVLPLLIIVSLFASIPTLGFSDKGFFETWEHGIVNERVFYAGTTGLFRNGAFHTFQEHPWSWEGQKLKEKCSEFGSCHYALHNIGFTGYSAGPDVYIVDRYGLGSAVMARITPELNDEWRIGHFLRPLPAGYMVYLKTGDLTYLEDVEIQNLLEKLEILTISPIFSENRFQVIFDLWFK